MQFCVPQHAHRDVLKLTANVQSDAAATSCTFGGTCHIPVTPQLYVLQFNMVRLLFQRLE